MTKYQFAHLKFITVMAVIFEILMVIAVILLGDSFVQNFLNIPTPLAQHIPLNIAIGVVLVLQYMIAALEMAARFRDDQRGFTIPLLFLPGGILVRSALMICIITLILTFKLIIYFVSVLLSFVFQVFRLDKYIGTSTLVDWSDLIFEPVEYIVNCIYNLLYFHKIRANSSILTSVFNGSLSLWCINH